MGKDKIPTFRECVDARYQNDTVMNGFATLLVILTPLAVLLIVYLLSNTDTAYGVLTDYIEKAVVICVAFESYVLLIVVYRLYTRLIKHSKRDKMWMMALTGYARSKGADTTKLEYSMKAARRKEHFLVRPIAFLLIAAMFVFLLWTVMDAVPYIEDLNGGNKDFVVIISGEVLFTPDVVYITIVGGFVIMFFAMIFVFIPTVKFAGNHEFRQVEFTRVFCKTMDTVGIHFRPMTQVVKRKSAFLALILMVFTGMYAMVFYTFILFRDMNNHLMNQWEYENELLRAVESDGACGFDNKFYESLTVTDRKGRKKSLSRKKLAKRTKNMAREENTLPGILVIAELFLVVLLGNYILKIIALGCMMTDDIDSYIVTLDTIGDITADAWTNMLLVVMDTFFVFTMIDSIMGIASRKASSWRKVVRSCFTFVIPLWISAFITNASGMSHLFDFNVYITTAILYDVLLMMIVSDRIRTYYTPAGYESPKMRSWIRYALWGNIVSTVTAGTAFADDAFDGTEFSGAASGSDRDGLDLKELKRRKDRR